jgi:K+-sensing histidine kinase KdpD
MKSLTKQAFEFEKNRDRSETEPASLDLSRFQEIFSQLSTTAMIGKIIPEVIHDINNYLTGILGYAELLSMKKIEDESIKNGLKNITFSAEQCKDLLANILSLSRQETSTVHLGDVNEVIEKTIELRKCALRHQEIEVVRALETKIPVVSVDGNKLQKALFYLIFKAEEILAHRPEGRKLFFKTHFDSPNQTISITIRANGFGMSPDCLAHFFEWYPAAESEDPGTAIGLKEAKQWIDDLGGTVQLDSVEGEGPSFVIHLPVKGKG